MIIFFNYYGDLKYGLFGSVKIFNVLSKHSSIFIIVLRGDYMFYFYYLSICIESIFFQNIYIFNLCLLYELLKYLSNLYI